jgi:alkanesulfonate monooxygenase SsuD/methylene tetrahydromethanopterin reductase-like flavin-dependent oxidoreductase (luciferase family)
MAGRKASSRRRRRSSRETGRRRGGSAGRNDAAARAQRERLAAHGPLSGFVGTVSQAIELMGQYNDAGIDLLIVSNLRNDDLETRELLVSEVMPCFAA